jgi:polysaccharide export outer membrane protein
LLDIRVFNRPEMGREVRIDNLGRIKLPFFDEFVVACLNERQVAQVVTEKYKKYLRDPQVDVFIKEYSSKPVAVIGSVIHPQRFQLQRRVRLLELLTYAGGPSQSAGGTVHVIHSEEGDPCATGEAKEAEAERPLLSSVKLSDLLAGSPAANRYIQPGDIISLPQAEQVFVIGNVFRPGAVAISGRLTLTSALAAAGGAIPKQGDKKHVRVIRQEPGTETRVMKIYNVEDIEKRQAEDVLLQANDVVEVPGARNIARSLLGILSPSAQQLPIYVIRGQ